MNANLITADCKLTPSWWDSTPRPAMPATQRPAAVDVVVPRARRRAMTANDRTERRGFST